MLSGGAAMGVYHAGVVKVSSFIVDPFWLSNLSSAMGGPLASMLGHNFRPFPLFCVEPAPLAPPTPPT